MYPLFFVQISSIYVIIDLGHFESWRGFFFVSKLVISEDAGQVHHWWCNCNPNPRCTFFRWRGTLVVAVVSLFAILTSLRPLPPQPEFRNILAIPFIVLIIVVIIFFITILTNWGGIKVTSPKIGRRSLNLCHLWLVACISANVVSYLSYLTSVWSVFTLLPLRLGLIFCPKDWAGTRCLTAPT